MLFNSFIFIALLLITLFLYYLPLFSKFQVQILIISSLVFYAYEAPALLLLLLFSAGINILTSYRVAYGEPHWRKTYATVGITLNLLILAVFKYSPLFANTFLDTNTGIGQFLILMPLPIGISFYTFEGISLLVDVYADKHHDKILVDRSLQKHFSKTLFFVSFFPHLIAGPILKAYEFYPQIKQKSIKDIDTTPAFKNLVTGYFLKVVVADNLAMLTQKLAFPYLKTCSSTDLVVMLFGYSFQIFADFAGYSLIAVGLAKLFGYDIMQNFNFPYISASITEFWRRWHISLSSFLKEYLYIPLGGNRKGKVRTYLNLLITMVLGGIWHGAAWSYAVWGLCHGILLGIERLWNDVFEKRKTNFFIYAFKVIVVFMLVSVLWLLFKLPFAEVLEYFKTVRLNTNYPINTDGIVLILIYSMPVIIYHAIYLFKKYESFSVWLNRYNYIGYGFLLAMIALNSGPKGSFIYFQF
ncbi:MAG: MBOAT family protein [Sphingobacteriaceae bacterium]|nr:MAG: MBOAT family protein [Sphingobacteriaceae bacterium]